MPTLRLPASSAAALAAARARGWRLGVVTNGRPDVQARKAEALRAHRTQHLSINRIFFSQPDVDRLLSMELFRQAWGPALAGRPEADLLAGL